MLELLQLTTRDFEFSVWANDVSVRARVYQETLTKRAGCQAEPEPIPDPELRFVPEIELVKVRFTGTLLGDENSSERNSRRPAQGDDALVSDPTAPEKRATLTLKSPLFFENTQYQFEWVFFEPVSNAHLAHRSQRVSEGFRFSPELKTRRGFILARLTGTIHTGNDVGWMRLSLTFEVQGKIHTQSIAFEVLPTKMALHQDLPAMYQAIDGPFPLWRFSLVEKTEQDVAQGKQRGDFPLMWLANFNQLRTCFEQGLKVICTAPHSRLQPRVAHMKAAKLKGRLPYRLGEQVKQDLANGRYDKRYRVEKKQLSVDTPENRFIKMVVTQCKRQLAEFEGRLRSSNQAPDRQRLSDTFLDELHHWQQPLQKVLSQSFLQDVGDFSGLNRASLVLQQKTGYSAVYRVWQSLKFYLDVFGSQSNMSMKSVAEIYEIWCFLQIRKILAVDLGFGEPKQRQPKLKRGVLDERHLMNGDKGAFEFYRDIDGVKANLYHEKSYGKETKEIRTFLLTHKPDIVLEVVLPDGKEFIWLFDAKYRIASIKTSAVNAFLGKPSTEEIDLWERASREERKGLTYRVEDGVPDDAINQMHRYRDALIRLSSPQLEKNQHPSSVSAKTPKKSRPVFGAFALYPGFFDQANAVNPYADAIEEIGIGAFALLPSAVNIHNEQEGQTNTSDDQSRGHSWLLAFLQAQIGVNWHQNVRYPVAGMAERLYVQEAARIPYDGMQQVLYPDLTMTVALGRREQRSPRYFDAFSKRTLRWYHMPVSTFELKFKTHVVDEIRYLAMIPDHLHPHQISELWPVRSIQIMARNKIDVAITGKESSSTALYFVFELGDPLSLTSSVAYQPDGSFRKSIRLTTLSQLEKVARLCDVTPVYQEALV